MVNVLQTALYRMTMEIRLALPYSIRLSGTNALEFLRTVDAGRYRQQGAGRLKFNKNADSFSVLNTLADPTGIQTGSGSAACLAGTAFCLVVYHIGQPLTAAEAVTSGYSTNAYLGAANNFQGNIATISAAGAHTLSFDNSNLASWDFGLGSPDQRFFIVDTPVSYICSGGEINRYASYSIAESQAVPPAGSANLLIDDVSSCSFAYSEATSTRFGILTVRIGITHPNSGESAELVQQIHTVAVP